MTAVRADHVGGLGGIALRAELELEPLDGIVGPPPAASRLGAFPLGDSHDVSALTLVVVVGYFIHPIDAHSGVVCRKQARHGTAAPEVVSRNCTCG
jgi:hypothetical protein